jgi:hypothetical protein
MKERVNIVVSASTVTSGGVEKASGGGVEKERGEESSNKGLHSNSLSHQRQYLNLFHTTSEMAAFETGLFPISDSQFTVELCGFLTAAARTNNADSMRQLLQAINEELTTALCAFNVEDETALISAAKRGHVSVLQMLLSHKDVAAFIDLQAPPHMCMYSLFWFFCLCLLLLLLLLLLLWLLLLLLLLLLLWLLLLLLCYLSILVVIAYR